MCALDRKTISIGTEDFKEIIDENGYLVDKTLMIQDLLNSSSKVTLFTRPRRFGKTLNQSMLRRFFEDERRPDGTPVDNRYLFDGLAISKCGEEYLRHQQQYPVINLSLKSAKQPDFEMAYQSLVDEIIKEFKRHEYVLRGEMADREREIFADILNETATGIQYAKSLDFLSKCLSGYHGKKCIILIDEYDVPLENAWFCGFYDKMISFMRSLLESALKTNSSLGVGIITGCLRISRESIFTGLNNLKINTVQGAGYGDAFGFTECEVKEMLAYYDLDDRYSEIRKWYDGYLFDDKEIYNPWSILNYVHDLTIRGDFLPQPYWSNTSSNSIIRDLVENADQEARDEIERLIAGESLEKPIHEDITYGDIHESKDNLWNFLYFTGYLKACGQRYDGERVFVRLEIPNAEVRSIYKNTIRSWFGRKLEETDQTPLLRALEAGDCEAMEEILSNYLLGTISFFDYKESYYHGFLTGVLKAAAKEYSVLSNRESGTGRPDLVLKTPRIRRGRAFVIEIKVAAAFREMEAGCREAMSQIENRNYAAALREEGYETIDCYGVCFFGKECMVAKTPERQ